MQGYREAPAAVPLVTYVANRLVAMDPRTGALWWERPVRTLPDRVLVAAGLVFLAMKADEGGVLYVLDLATGVERDSILLAFRVNAALATADLLYFSGFDGVIALTPSGAIQFRVTNVRTSAWDDTRHYLVGEDVHRHELWRVKESDGEHRDGGSFLALGEQTAQPDIDT